MISGKNRVVTIRLTQEEGAILEAEAQKCGISVSAYIRSRALGGNVVPIVDAKAVSLFRKLGGLLKFATLRREDLRAQHTINALARLAEVVGERIAKGQGQQLTPEVEQNVLSGLDTTMQQQLAKFDMDEENTTE